MLVERVVSIDAVDRMTVSQLVWWAEAAQQRRRKADKSPPKKS